MKEARIVALPIVPETGLDSLFLNNPFTIKPIKGKQRNQVN